MAQKLDPIPRSALQTALQNLSSLCCTPPDLIEVPSDFNQEDYWVHRHRRLQGDPRSVGNLGLTIEENLAGEKKLRNALEISLKRLGVHGTVLDVGCGYGRLAPVFCGADLTYTGIDVSPDAIESARLFEPKGRYLVGSALVCDWGGPFDVIAAMYVLAHFVDDQDWSDLLRRISTSLRSGGYMIFADNLDAVEKTPALHVKNRSLSDYAGAFSRLSMRIDTEFNERLASELGGRTHIHIVHKYT